MIAGKRNPTDIHVGSRIRMRRLILGMSQSALGDALGLTFQQVQKYEKGTNRVGSSRLQQISEILGVPVPHFFEGLPGSASLADDPTPALVSAGVLELAKAVQRIKSRGTRQSIVALVEELAQRTHK